MPRPFDLPPPPPLDEQQGDSFRHLVRLMQRLLAPDGCPWDREQDERSLRRYVLEEACEVIDAIDSGDHDELKDELGDLALQIAFLAELGRRRGTFGPDDVTHSICEKLVRRHPHVFGQAEAATPGEVEANWERIKRQEKQGRPILDSIPRSLPALQRALEEQSRAAKVGFDWPNTDLVRDKINEELEELDEALTAGDHEHAQEEFGDLLFALANWARHNQIDPEKALRGTCDKFRERFAHVESRVKQVHGDWPRNEKGKPTTGITLDELETYYAEIKRAERQRSETQRADRRADKNEQRQSQPE